MLDRPRNDQPVVLVPAPPDAGDDPRTRTGPGRVLVALLLGGMIGAFGAVVSGGIGDDVAEQTVSRWIGGELEFLLPGESSAPEPSDAEGAAPVEWGPEGPTPGPAPPAEERAGPAPEEPAETEAPAEEPAGPVTERPAERGEAPAGSGTGPTATPADPVEVDRPVAAPGGNEPAPDPITLPGRVEDRVAPDESGPGPAEGAPPSEGEAFGRLFVSSYPWARVYVNGELVGTTPVVGLDVPPGLLLLRIEREGFAPHREQVQVAPGSELRRTGIVLDPGP